jgi:hypothetical protein
MIPSQAQLATRYVQQTLAILAWPVGFAVTELVAYHLLTAYANNLAVGLRPDAGRNRRRLVREPARRTAGGALWLIIGSIATPFLMQGLICSGSPMSGGGSTALHQLYALQQLTYMVKTMKTAGLAAPALAASAAKTGGASGTAGGPGLPPPPPPATPPPAPAPSAPAPNTDPAGDQAAAAAISSLTLPAAQRSI